MNILRRNSSRSRMARCVIAFPFLALAAGFGQLFQFAAIEGVVIVVGRGRSLCIQFAPLASFAFGHGGKLHRSRGADAPEVCFRLPLPANRGAGSRPRKSEGSGAPRGAFNQPPAFAFRLRRARVRFATRTRRLSAHRLRRFLIPGPRFQETPRFVLGACSAQAQHLNAPLSRRGDARRPVQRAPRRRVIVPNGSVPGTSRVPAYEAGPRAPRQPSPVAGSRSGRRER